MPIFDKVKQALNSFLREIDSFFDRDPAAHSRIEILLLYPGLHAVLLHRLCHAMWQTGFFPLKFLARFFAYFSRFLTGIEIHPGARIGKNLFIDHGTGVVIGETARIGNNVTIYHGVTLGGVSPQDSKKGSIRHPQVEDDVIIGSGAQLLGAIKVGRGAKIGSNAVVVSNVEESAIMVGVPARKIEPKPIASANQKAEKSDSDKKFPADNEAVSTTHPSFIAYASDIDYKQDPRQKLIDNLASELEKLKGKINKLEADNEILSKSAQLWQGTTEHKHDGRIKHNDFQSEPKAYDERRTGTKEQNRTKSESKKPASNSSKKPQKHRAKNISKSKSYNPKQVS